ncbi:alpha/beta hydrolase [Cellulosilyticum ruminicola]|uniref:alpha/beta hydrolase n=1 Tax=Cellulosilyticum ruminicola TaxID=425254 RepID=UPI0006D1AB1E|nr:alpha/beta hydrolase [Cellulosilyticum ruminicola]
MSKYDINEDFEAYVSICEQGNKNIEAEELLKELVKNSAIGKLVWERNKSDKEIEVTKDNFNSFDGESINVQIIEPHNLEAKAPCIIYYHGGGFVASALDFHRRLVREYALGAKCKVIYVDYRLAFEHPFPIGLEDSYSCLEWVIENANVLDIDTDRIAVAGDSAGGTLATAVAQMARDRMNKKLCFQMLCYPVTDYRQQTESMQTFIDTPIWNAKLNHSMWQVYLRNGIRSVRNAQEDMLPYASPMATKNFENLPPAYIEISEFDPVRDEGKAYAELLSNHGIPVILNETKRTIHGYDAVKNSRITQENTQKRIAALKEAFNTFKI